MNKKNYIILASILGTFALAVEWLHANTNRIPGLEHADPFVIQVIVTVVGILAAAVAAWIMTKGNKKSGAGAAAGGDGATAVE